MAASCTFLSAAHERICKPQLRQEARATFSPTIQTYDHRHHVSFKSSDKHPHMTDPVSLNLHGEGQEPGSCSQRSKLEAKQCRRRSPR